MTDTVISPAAKTKEEIFDHIYKNSWMNVADFECWVIGIADSDTVSKEWFDQNADPKPRYWKTWDAETPATARELVNYFIELGAKNTPKYPESPGEHKIIYLYKTWI